MHIMQLNSHHSNLYVTDDIYGLKFALLKFFFLQVSGDF